MPYINMQIGTHLNSSQYEELFTRATSLISSIMGKRAEVTAVHIQESTPNQWSINSSSLKHESPVAAYVDIKVTEGTNTPEEKAKMISETVKMIKECIGEIQEACYVVIDDIPSNSWGYNGKTQAHRATAYRGVT